MSCNTITGCNPIDDMTEARNYIKLKLGSPVVCVEVDDTQLTQIICDAVQDASRYLYDEANRRDFMAFSITSGVSAYQMDECITAVVEFSMLDYLDGINVMHSPTNMLLYNDWANQRNYPGGPGNGGGASLVGYDIAMMYFKEVQNQFSTRYLCTFHQPSGLLTLVPTPKLNGTGLLEVWKKTDIKFMLDHPLVKKLMVARAMMQWGLHLSKYSVNMAGGGTANGELIYQRGADMEEKAIEELKQSSYFPQFFVG